MRLGKPRLRSVRCGGIADVFRPVAPCAAKLEPRPVAKSRQELPCRIRVHVEFDARICACGYDRTCREPSAARLVDCGSDFIQIDEFRKDTTMPDSSLALAAQDEQRFLLVPLQQNFLADTLEEGLPVAGDMPLATMINFNRKHSSIEAVRKCGCVGRRQRNRAWIRMSPTGPVLETKQCTIRHSCPQYAMVKSKATKRDLEQALAEGLAHGSVLLCTITVPHTNDETLAEVLERAVTLCRRLFNSRSSFVTDLQKTLGLVGHFRTLEVCHGHNGWHPHFHVLVFVDSQDGEAIERVISNYASHLELARRDAGIPQNGYTGYELIRVTGENAPQKKAWYLTKQNPVTCVAGKCGGSEEGDGLCAWCLRRRAGESDASAEDIERVLEFERAMHNTQMERWSNGLRAHFGLREGGSHADRADLGPFAEERSATQGPGYFVEDLEALTSDAHLEIGMIAQVKDGGIEAGLCFCQEMHIPTSRAA